MATGLARGALSSLAICRGGEWIKMLGVLSGPGATSKGFASALPRGAQAVSNQADGTIRRAAAAGCHTGVFTTFWDVHNKFQDYYRRKAYLRLYLSEGMDEQEFSRAVDFLFGLERATLGNFIEQENAPEESEQ